MLASTWICAGLLLACGTANTPPSSADAPPTPASDSVAAPPASDSEPPGSAKPDSVESDTEADAPAGDDTASDAQRELRYRVRPGGVTVDVDGVTFEARASAVRVGRGWGVEVKVEATLKDPGTRSLLNPKHGPLAFAGVARGDTFSDQRDGDEEQLLTSGQTQTFSRTWPEGAVKPLTAGQSLELKVGLWGLGRDAQSRQPIRQFLLVKMSAGKKQATPVLTPPDAFMGGT